MFQIIIRLGKEITSFTNYMNLTAKEMTVREILVENISEIILDVYSDAKVTTSGSYATGLCFPTSNIDIVVEDNTSVEHIFFKHLKQAFLLNPNFAKVTYINGKVSILVLHMIQDSDIEIARH